MESSLEWNKTVARLIDEILTIGGKSPSEIKEAIQEYFSISNESGVSRRAAIYARITTNPTITYISDGKIKTETFTTRQSVTSDNYTLYPRILNEAYGLVEDGTIGCITIGSQTAGADGNISIFYISNGLQTVISGLGVNYPDGTETQRVGIRIDEIVKPTIAGIKAGKDELYERAVELINQ